MFNVFLPGKIKTFVLSFFSILLMSTSFSQNPIITENALTGTLQSSWDAPDEGTIEGFAQEFSVNKGETVHFKIEIQNATNVAYTAKVYRLGYYNGRGARFITDLGAGLVGKLQAPYNYESSTGKVDCSNWTVSTQWVVPTTAVSGVYILRLDCPAVSGKTTLVFVVRDDAANAPMLFKTSDATWQAYNNYGGNTFYIAGTPVPGYSHATKVSYQRPVALRGDKSSFYNAEYPMIRWMERNGYHVSYTTDMDMARNTTPITPANHKVLLSVGHDEYWSTEMRNNFETARSNGVHLAFFSGNEVYWKTRWENNFQTLVCYKEGTMGESTCGSKCDPVANVWTGLWRDGCSPPYAANDGCKPEGALTGHMSWTQSTGSIKVPHTYKNLRFWKNTSIASLATGQTATLPYGTLGNEWDPEQFTESFPSHRVILSNTVQGGLNHKMSLYRHSSGALVFGAGTMQWSWGLDNVHDINTATPPNLPASTDMQQATVNLFHDMGVTAGNLQTGLVAPTIGPDALAPNSTIVSPTHMSTVSGGNVTISGTSMDNGTGAIAGVEVSINNGATWSLANGLENWSYTFSPAGYGTIIVKVRAWDDLGNLEVPGAPGSPNAIEISLSGPLHYSVFNASHPTTPPVFFTGAPVELGMKFRASVAGFITGFRYYKGPGVTGVHTGHLWTSTGTLLATQVFTNETASGWQSVALATPVAINANTTYVVSYFTASGDFTRQDPFFTTAIVNGFLRGLANGEDGGNGVYEYNSTSVFPFNTSGSSNYYADVEFETADIIAPQVLSVNPANSSTGVSLNIEPAATFDEPISASSVTNATVIMTGPGNTVIPGTASVSGAVVKYTPSSALTIGTLYSVTLKGGTNEPLIKDISGNPLAADYTWSFTTGGLNAPVVTTHPASQSTCSNSSISFVSAANGIPTPTVQWQVSTDNGVIWTDIPSATAATYNFTAVTADNNNQYHAVWTNSQGTATSNPATLLVEATITASLAAVNANICPGAPLQLELTSATGPSPYSLQINGNTYAAVNVGVPFKPFGTSESIWAPATTPLEFTHPDNGPVVLGVKFQSNKGGVIRGIRFFKGGVANGGIHIGALWSLSGTSLASATFTSETASGWQEVLFSAPVEVTANTVYVASYFAPLGNYSKDPGYFSAPISNGNSLTALQDGAESNCVYVYSGASAFPDQPSFGTNYWVDVLFAPYPTSTTTFNLTNISASNSCAASGSPLASVTITVSAVVNAGTVSGVSPLCIGASASYTTNGHPGGSWSSSNTSVVTVNAVTGQVTAQGQGTANIIYTITGCDGTKTSSASVTVSPNANPGTVTGTSPLCIGASALYSSNGELGGVWSSSNMAAATVNATTGMVTAVAVGNTNIVYTLNTGCNSPLSAFQALTVSPDLNPGTVSGSTTLCTGVTETFTSNGDAGGTWSSTNTSVANVDASGLVSTLMAGITDIRYNFNSGCGSPVFAALTLTVNGSGSLAGTAGGPMVCSSGSVSPSGSGYLDASCNSIARITPSGAIPVSGNINTCVEVDDVVKTYQNLPYVQRHYSISPDVNGTATITLYVTQGEFDAYNLARGIYPALPNNSADVTGKLNLRITQFHGTGTYPGNYSGSSELINPDDNLIVWNAGMNRWEITFDISGFSGFYIHSNYGGGPLPVNLLSFNGKNNGSYNLLEWSTSSEQNSNYFEVQRSMDGANFENVQRISAAGNSSSEKHYNYEDNISSFVQQLFYYRLKQVDISGVVKYSAIVKIKLNNADTKVEVSPNPFAQSIRVQVEAQQPSKALLRLTDMSGRTLYQQSAQLRSGSNAIMMNNLGNLPSGVYLLNIITDTKKETVKVVKQ